MTYYQKHVFVCTNQKVQGKKCCAQGGADEMWAYAKATLQDRGLWGAGKVRLSKSGCLGRCSEGPCIVIYPDSVWYTYASEADITLIIDQHLLKNQVVERLLLDIDGD